MRGVEREPFVTVTVFRLSLLGLVHTLLSLVPLIAAAVALVRDRRISFKNTIGKVYVISLVISVLTGLPIVRHGGIGPGHVVGILTLIVLAVAIAAEKGQAFVRASIYVESFCYSDSVLFLLIPTVTETLTRIPVEAPLAASPEAPLVQGTYGLLFLLLVIGIVLQFRSLRAERRLATAGKE